MLQISDILVDHFTDTQLVKERESVTEMTFIYGIMACPDYARQLLSNLFCLEQLFSVRASLSNFFLFCQFLSNFL